MAFSVLVLSACGGGWSEAAGIQAISTRSGSLSAGAPFTAPTTADSDSSTVSEAAAVRFLEQSSFGPTTASIQRVRELGFSAYIDEQFSLAPSTYAKPLDSDPGMTVLHQRFFRNALNGPDQLRQRMAFALSEIFVVSSRGIFNKDAIASYQRMLLNRSLGNFRDLLRDVTLHPTMGRYLDMANNAAGESPNENYAREVMQLFTVGPVKLWLDGSPQTDASGNTIPTYSQEDVEGLARALTGWTYATRPGEIRKPRNPPHYYGSMIASDSLHDFESKTLLSGKVLPAGQSVEQDLDGALTALFMHPNVGPFISFRLIQNFVTSNPRPSYVRRVAEVFNDNGNGVRGDLKAVIRAILLDTEARRGDDPDQARTVDGKLKEPVLFITGLLRALDATSRNQNLNPHSTQMGQSLFSAPSVFNFYPPHYALPGAELYGPEFKLRTGPSIIAIANFVNAAIYRYVPDVMTFDLSKWKRLSDEGTDALVDAINLRFLHGAMSDSMRATLVAAVDSHPARYSTMRAQTALYLTATSSQFAVQR